MSPDEIFASQMWTWPDPMLKRDASGRVIVVNAAFLQLYGGQATDWTGNPVTGWPAPQGIGTSSRFDTRLPNADGTETVYDWLEFTLQDGSALALARNVTAFIDLQATAPVAAPTQAETPPVSHNPPPITETPVEMAAIEQAAPPPVAAPAPPPTVPPHLETAYQPETQAPVEQFPAQAQAQAQVQAQIPVQAPAQTQPPAQAYAPPPAQPASAYTPPVDTQAIAQAYTPPPAAEIPAPVSSPPPIVPPAPPLQSEPPAMGAIPAAPAPMPPVGTQPAALQIPAAPQAPDSVPPAQPAQAPIAPANAAPAPTPAIPPAPTPVETVADNKPRDFERRALPIENQDAVLGNNWRDAVIAKAVGVEDLAAKTAEDEQAAPASPEQQANTDQSCSGVKILLAEDNAINALLTRTLLEAEGCTVDVVEDGALAVEAVRNGAYDMIFMDMRMPNMDGLEATRKIRAMGHGADKLPIVALTANAFDDDRNACFDSGMNDFMTKPVAAEELSEMVNTHTGALAERMAS